MTPHAQALPDAAPKLRHGAGVGVPVATLLRTLAAPPPQLVIECHAVRVKGDLMPEPFTLRAGEGHPCSVALLWQYWHVCQVEGQPLTDVLFRPLDPDGKTFLEKKSSSCTYNMRVKKRFAEAGVPYTPTPHGSRRGAVQHAEGLGADDEELAALARIKTPKVCMWYRDRRRHTGGRLPRVPRGGVHKGAQRKD